MWIKEANATFPVPQLVPVDRLIKNTTAFTKENPANAHGYYVLARIHYLAFANKASLVAGTDSVSPPLVHPDWLWPDFPGLVRHHHAIKLTLKEFGYASYQDVSEKERSRFEKLMYEKRRQLGKEGWEYEKLNDQELVNHASVAVRNFKKAIELDAENGLYHLGLASLLEQYVQFLKEIEINMVPEEFRSIILERAEEIYYIAYKLSIKKDLKRERKSLAGLEGLIGYEAGKAYIRLSELDKSTYEQKKKKILMVKENLGKLDELPNGPITPIVFSFEKHSIWSDLLSPDLHVRFDLDGDGVVELWPWVKPTTGILVWDPDGKGIITSGRQLFGSVSWWLFFADGYQALDALDDNRDGVLTGHELTGISVWFDRNSNGNSDPGEVVPIQTIDIVQLVTESSSQDHGLPMNISGLRLTDGYIFPTYDWIASPVESLPQLSQGTSITNE